MLPTEDAAWVGREMARRFGVPYWNFALTATDANRFAIRWARQVTGPLQGRRAQLVLPRVGRRVVRHRSTTTATSCARDGNVGKPVPLDETTRVVEINDLDGLERGARARRRRGLPVRAGAHEHRHRAAGARLPRGGPRALHEVRHAAADRRDAHDQRRSRRLHEGVGAAARHRHDRQDARRGHPERRLRDERGAERPRLRAHRLEERRRRRRRRHARRQRAVAGGDARHARRGHDRRGVRADDRAGRAVRGGRAGRDRQSRELPWHVMRLGCRVEYLFRAGAGAHRQRGGGRSGRGAGPVHPPVPAEPGHPDDAVPQHGADVAGHDGRGRRSAHRGVRRRRPTS